METNREIELAGKIIEETGMNLFLTGKAGTGKTTFLKNLRHSCTKRMVVLSPTGIAAINAGGMTIHSFFQLSFAPFVPGIPRKDNNVHRMSKEKIKLIKTLDLLVIDEISMVRADLLDAIDDVLRHLRDHSLPFGGVQLLLIGDLQQLAPVVTDNEREVLSAIYPTPYFFSSKALSSTEYLTVELKHVFRQQDSNFIRLLNRVRDNSADSEILRELNNRYIPDFNPPENEGYIRLVTHNYQANRINEQTLARLNTEEYSFEAEVHGDFPEKSYPAERNLVLKEGSQIMFLKNDTERKFFNGMIGKVEKIQNGEILVSRNHDGYCFRLEPVSWDNIKYSLNSETGDITEDIVGSFSQYPVKLAWAITIHKSQGLTFDKAIIDASHSFAHGQAYVALSRCRSLEGLILDAPISLSSIICDSNVIEFSRVRSAGAPDISMIEQMKKHYMIQLLNELFSFNSIFSSFQVLKRNVDEFVQYNFPSIAKRYKNLEKQLQESVIPVASKFIAQCISICNMASEESNEDFLQKRIQAACNYFIPVVEDLLDDLYSLTDADTDSELARKRLEKSFSEVTYLLQLREFLLKQMLITKFSTESFLRAKSEFILKNDKDNRNLNRRKRVGNKKRMNSNTLSDQSGSAEDNTETDIYSSDPDNNKILNPKLFEILREWRITRSRNDDVPAFRIIKTSSLIFIANYLPTSLEMLSKVPGIGNKKIEAYGNELTDIITEYLILHPDANKRDISTKVINRKNNEKRVPAGNRTDTYTLTFDLWKDSHDIEKIAQERNLSVITVQGHIARLLKDKRIDIADILPTERINLIRSSMEVLTTSGNHTPTMTEIRNHILERQGIEIPFEEIKYVVSAF